MILSPKKIIDNWSVLARLQHRSLNITFEHKRILMFKLTVNQNTASFLCIGRNVLFENITKNVVFDA